MRIRDLWRAGHDTMQIAERLGIPEAFVLKAITVTRRQPSVYFDVWPPMAALTHSRRFSQEEVRTRFKARRTGIFEHRFRK